MGTMVRQGILWAAGLALAAWVGYQIGTRQPHVDGRRVELMENRCWRFALPLDQAQTENGVTYRLLDVDAVPLLTGKDRYEARVQVTFLVTPSARPNPGMVRAVLKDVQDRELSGLKSTWTNGATSGFPMPEDVPDNSQLVELSFKPSECPDEFSVEITDTRSGQPAQFRFDHLKPLYREGGSVRPVTAR